MGKNIKKNRHSADRIKPHSESYLKQGSQADPRVTARQCRHLENAFEVRQRAFRRKFELIAVQGHQRSSILVPVESPYATSY